MLAPLSPNQPFHISTGLSPEGGRQLLALRHIAATHIENGLQIPLGEGLDLIAAAFDILSRTPGTAGMLAMRTGSDGMIEQMRQFVASYDQWKASQKGHGHD